MVRSPGALLVVSVVVLIGCASGERSETEVQTPPYEVTESVASHETTRTISVWAPTAGAPGPVVYMAHGLGGSREELALTAAALAEQGVVAFVPDYRSEGPLDHNEQDLVCAYRYTRSIAEDHGGDLDQPVTFVGFSAGATRLMFAGLDERRYGPDGTYEACFAGTPLPEVIVPIAGCHYESPDGQLTSFPMLISNWANPDAELVLVAGERDETCPAWQSREATEALRRAGYDARYVEVEEGTHPTLVYNDRTVDGEWIHAPDASAGDVTVEVILDAIADTTR